MGWQTKAAFQIVLCCCAVVVVVVVGSFVCSSNNVAVATNNFYTTFWCPSLIDGTIGHHHIIVQYHCICIPRVLERLYTPLYI
jgi:hypothetical protein